ncbi:hypothetical protein PWT90_10542 [Aphanocladium album]|nr:hypothetical protein PWT90_10542 [Aphanocladium album]
MSSSRAVVVVGAGVFGIAAVQAYLLAGFRVIWISDEDQVAASSGECRIVRDAYVDPTHRQFAGQAIAAFKTESPYKSFYTEREWVVMQTEQQQQQQHQSISSDGEPMRLAVFENMFPGANLAAINSITRSPSIGVVAASELRRAMVGEITRAHNHRVTVIKAEVTDIVIENGLCKGIDLSEGSEICADEIILATGWKTNALLAKHDLKASYEVVGVTTLGIRPGAGQEYLLSKPIICVPGEGEIIPLPKDGIIICNSHHSYSFASSRVPDKLNPDDKCFNENRAFIAKYWPELSKCELVFARLSCDALTPSQSPFAINVEGAERLRVVGGGSFHYFKFLPVLSLVLTEALGLGPKGVVGWEALTDTMSLKHRNLIPRREWP